MNLTTAQLQTWKADIAANAATVTYQGVATAIDALPNTADANDAIARWYNQAAAPAYKGWGIAVARSAIRTNLVLANYTPNDAVPASPSTDLTYSNRALVAQLKQANAIFLATGDGTADATAAGFRQSCQDCMRNIPTGTSGAAADAGWGPPATPGAVRLALQVSLTNLEKLFAVAGSGVGNTGADPRGSATNPDVPGTDGGGSPIQGVQVSQADVLNARNS